MAVVLFLADAMRLQFVKDNLFTMEFKIDTRKNYTLIIPLRDHLDANLAASLDQKCTELTDSGSENFLVNLSACQAADVDAFSTLGDLHGQCYSSGQSLVFYDLSDEVMQLLKDEEMDVILNIAPTEQEAVDIVNMEILERDLFDEES